MANYGNELQEWIQQIAINSTNNKLAANTQATNKIASMDAEIKKLTAVIAQMANKSNNGKNINPNMSSGNRNSRPPRIRNHSTWADIATPTTTTLLVPSTPVQTAVGKRTATMTKQHGPTPLV
jgi:hypothetical protein